MFDKIIFKFLIVVFDNFIKFFKKITLLSHSNLINNVNYIYKFLNYLTFENLYFFFYNDLRNLNLSKMKYKIFILLYINTFCICD